MSKVYIKFMKDEVLTAIKKHIDVVQENMLKNKGSNLWLLNHFDKSPFIEKKFEFEDFDLKENDNYKLVDYENSIMLYEHFNHLPRYILTDERFWAWLNFDKFYKIALNAMPLNPKKVSTLKDHYLFSNGERRSIFFGVLSRCYFRVERTIDRRLSDPYELTKFIIENPERFRNLSWRSLSNQKHIVLAVLKAEKKVYDEFSGDIKNSVFPILAKEISKLGSVMLIDSIDEQNMIELAYNSLLRILKEEKLNETLS